MKAMILAAGLGTRLRPWTLNHPKALVPVGGVPMLQRVIEKLEQQGFDHIVINIHHFGEQIIDFINSHSFKADIFISDEREKLLDTGGGIVHAAPWLCTDDEPFLIHNVDILSNANLAELISFHKDYNTEASLLVSERQSSRKLIFSEDMRLQGWHNIFTDEYRPAGFNGKGSEYAFSGIYTISPTLVRKMSDYKPDTPFPIMDFFLDNVTHTRIYGKHADNLNIIDIGKPDTLNKANEIMG
jgi:N-acetyl-alpha-D-muramate 1-phosphate uridylyltransferase